MASTRPRISPRHVFALCAFLVPLAVLAVLGRNELQRSGDLAKAALEGEAREFLARARLAVEQELDRKLDEAARSVERELREATPVRATATLREQFPALRSLLMLDAQLDLTWPSLPLSNINLPFVRESLRGPDSPGHGMLQAADLLQATDHVAEATGLLHYLADTLATANPPGSDWRPEFAESEIVARFRLATAMRRQQQHTAARGEYERVRQLAGRFTRGFANESTTFGLLAEAAMAELDGANACLSLLRAIAENQRASHDDGLLGALAQRASNTIGADAPERAVADLLLLENDLRADAREFAAKYEVFLKVLLRLRRSRQGDATPVSERLVATIGDDILLLDVRPATDDERRRWQCEHVALHFDLGKLLAPVLHAFADAEGTFLLAVGDTEPDAKAIVPPPAQVPKGFVPPAVETNDLVLRAYPAEPDRVEAAAAAAEQQRTLMLLAVFVTALGGVLWSWRAVSRESELAALKIDLVSRVSHELKTPLALIRMYGETLGLGRARDPQQAAEFGGIISRESERLTALIQRILDFSRQQAGTLEYSPQPHDLGELLRRIAADYAPHLESRGVLLIDDLPHGIHVRCDASGCESAIVNLLENAAKYGPEGAEEHEVDLVLRASDGEATVEVMDRGRGIPTGEHERVFAGFHRASNAGEVRGAGLGLNLVRHFARAHGGDAIALPRDGGGTIVRLTLPLATDPDPANANPDPGAHAGARP